MTEAEAPFAAPNVSRAVRRVVIITLIFNVLVAVAKIAYGYYAAALSIRADGFHSLTDSANNVVGLVGLWIASQPPDREHPYGHQKFEIFAATLVGLSLLLMALDVIREAISRVWGSAAQLPEISTGAFVVLGGTLAVNLAVTLYEHRKGKEYGSQFLLSDAAHTRSDVLVTLGVIIAMIFVRMGYLMADLIAAGVVAITVGYAGYAVIRKNVGYLADSAVIDPEKIQTIVREVPGVASASNIRTRGTPGAVYVDLNIQIAPHLDVYQAHQVSHRVIDAIKSNFEGVLDVVPHTEPAKPHQRYKPFPEDEVEVDR